MSILDTLKGLFRRPRVGSTTSKQESVWDAQPPPHWMVVGLRKPGAKYAATPHNKR
jgi:hypothetical protein